LFFSPIPEGTKFQFRDRYILLTSAVVEVTVAPAGPLPAQSFAERRRIAGENKTYSLRESSPPYTHLFERKNRFLSQNNAYLWDTIPDSTDT
jgi:hypothetical protein